MRKLQSFIGMPVVCQSRRIGRLLRSELSEDLTRLKGIWVGSGLRATRWIPAEDLQMLGQVAVFCDGCGKRGRVSSEPLFRRATATDGVRLGAITGAEIDEVSFAVTALELSQGFWDDLIYGRHAIRSFTVDRETGGVIVGPAGHGKGEDDDEGRHDQGAAGRNDDRFSCCDGIRRHELADRAQVEPEGQDDRELDI